LVSRSFGVHLFILLYHVLKLPEFENGNVSSANFQELTFNAALNFLIYTEYKIKNGGKYLMKRKVIQD